MCTIENTIADRRTSNTASTPEENEGSILRMSRGCTAFIPHTKLVCCVSIDRPLEIERPLRMDLLTRLPVFPAARPRISLRRSPRRISRYLDTTRLDPGSRPSIGTSENWKTCSSFWLFRNVTEKFRSWTLTSLRTRGATDTSDIGRRTTSEDGFDYFPRTFSIPWS